MKGNMIPTLVKLSALNEARPEFDWDILCQKLLDIVPWTKENVSNVVFEGVTDSMLISNLGRHNNGIVVVTRKLDGHTSNFVVKLQSHSLEALQWVNPKEEFICGQKFLDYVAENYKGGIFSAEFQSIKPIHFKETLDRTRSLMVSPFATTVWHALVESTRKFIDSGALQSRKYEHADKCDKLINEIKTTYGTHLIPKPTNKENIEYSLFQIDANVTGNYLEAIQFLRLDPSHYALLKEKSQEEIDRSLQIELISNRQFEAKDEGGNLLSRTTLRNIMENYENRHGIDRGMSQQHLRIFNVYKLAQGTPNSALQQLIDAGVFTDKTEEIYKRIKEFYYYLKDEDRTITMETAHELFGSQLYVQRNLYDFRYEFVKSNSVDLLSMLETAYVDGSVEVNDKTKLNDFLSALKGNIKSIRLALFELQACALQGAIRGGFTNFDMKLENMAIIYTNDTEGSPKWHTIDTDKKQSFVTAPIDHGTCAHFSANDVAVFANDNAWSLRSDDNNNNTLQFFYSTTQSGKNGLLINPLGEKNAKFHPNFFVDLTVGSAVVNQTPIFTLTARKRLACEKAGWFPL